MRGRRALLAVALLLAVAGGGALLAAPAFVDWDARRAQVARLAAERLGRPVAVSGPLRLSLLPRPVLEASDVLVGEGGDGLEVSTRALRLRLDAPSLLLGRLVVRELSLVGAEIRLPWPPTPFGSLAPPSWLSAFDARLEDGRLRVGAVVLEGVSARLLAGGPAEALAAEGVFRWGGREVRFAGTLGRGGEDGAAPLELTLASDGGQMELTGILLGEGAFEGRLAAAGSGLAAALPAPPGPFRLSAQISGTPELLAAQALALELGGATLSGAASLRLQPRAQLEATLATPRLDLVPWLEALRGTQPLALPVGLDLAAESASLGPLRLRLLRATAHREGDRLTLSDVTATLPGDGRLEAAGASAGPRLDLALRVAAADGRRMLESLGWPGAVPLPAGAAEGRAQLSVEGSRIAAREVDLRLGPSRITGGLTLRREARPALALGLEADAVSLDVAAPELLGALRGAGAGADLELRLGLGSLRLADGAWEEVSLDAAAEAERWVVRRLAARRWGLGIAASGAFAAGRFGDATLEAEGPAGPALALLGHARPALGDAPLRLRAALSGPPDALALRGEAELGEARLESQGTLDLRGRRGQGTTTLRHPGAARFLGAALAREPPAFLGEGSLSLVLNGQWRPEGLSADGFELVAGGLRARGNLALARGAAPLLSGTLRFEALPLPEWGELLPGRWPLLDLGIEAAEVTLPGLPPLLEATARLRADAESLRLEEARARVASGEATALLRFRRGEVPVLEAEGALVDAVLPGPLFGTPLDVAAGRLAAEWRLRGTGASAEAMLGSLSGGGRITLRDAVLRGLDAPAAAAALGWEDTARAEAALRDALADGSTTLGAGELRLSVASGVVRVEDGRLLAEGDLPLDLSGTVDLPREVLDLRLRWPGAPGVTLRATGPAAAPTRLPGLGEWLRARAGPPAPEGAPSAPR